MFCDLTTSYTDDEDACNKGLFSAKKKKNPHMPDMFGFSKLQRMVFFSEDDFYEFMADPWLEKLY